MKLKDRTPLALVGQLSIEASDGTMLRASSDIQLAWAWAAVECNAQGLLWPKLSYGQQCRYVADALVELKRAYAEVSDEDPS